MPSLQKVNQAIEAMIAKGTEFQQLPPSEARRVAVREMQDADHDVVRAIDSYRSAVLDATAALRAKSEATVDPAQRMADELERARLVASNLNADVFIERAKDALAGGQPRRAAFFFSVAEDKGASGMTLHFLNQGIEAGLELADPDLSKAVELEAALATNLAELGRNRLRILKASGVGLAADGQAGDGSSENVASASVAKKMADYFDKTSKGEVYEAEAADLPVPDAPGQKTSRPGNSQGLAWTGRSR